MNIAAYCRVSTDKADQLNSLEAQKRFFAEYTEKHGHRLVRLYADEGISGTRIRNRAQFLRLLQDAEQGLFQMVVVKDISRFARNTVDLLQSTRKLKALGIETVFLTANMGALGDGEFVLTLFAALAQEESANTSKRIKFGKQLNAAKGRVPNLVYGYDKVPGDYFSLSVNAREAATVRQIYRWYVAEGFGALKIANLLNEQGCRTKRGYAWSQNAVSRILTNALYCGKVINGKQEVRDFLTGARENKDQETWQVVEKPELAVISPGLFDEAQAILARRGQALQACHERQSNRYLFSTLIKCGDCGRSFRRVSRTYQNTYVRWVCSARNGQGVRACPNACGLEEPALTAAIGDYFAALLGDGRQAAQALSREAARLCQERRLGPGEEKTLRSQRAKLEKARQRYLELYAGELISREELQTRLEETAAELTRVERELGASRRPLPAGRQLERLLLKACPDLRELCSPSCLSNAQLKRIVRRIQVNRDGRVDVYLQRLGPGVGEAADAWPADAWRPDAVPDQHNRT